jgi:hypothetical protein
MKRHRTTISALALIGGLAAPAPAPAPALAAAPLLSGYGGPGAGAQTIVGAALLNGPGSGSGGPGGGPSGGGSSRSGSTGGAQGGLGAGATGTASSSTVGTHATSATKEHANGGRTPSGSAQIAGAATSSHPRAAGANPNPSQLGASQAAAIETGASWFSGVDLLALVLVAGALAVVALATARLARAEQH